MNPAKPMPIVHRLLQVGLLLACLGWITPSGAWSNGLIGNSTTTKAARKPSSTSRHLKKKTNAVYTMYYATPLAR